MATISWPTGLISHMQEWATGVPGVNLPEWAAPQQKLVTLYPADMVERGYVYIRAEAAKDLRVGDPIQIDRTHATIRAIGDPEMVEDAGRSPQEQVLACRVLLSRERSFV